MMRNERLIPLFSRGVFLLVTAIASVGLPVGCGGGSKETGTQVEVPASALEDAQRSSDYYDQQAKKKK